MKKDEIKKMLNSGAPVVDVRTPSEFQGGHAKDAKNIPLNEVQSRADEFKSMEQPIVLCCASGNRSGQAAAYLKQQGVSCENGGGWAEVAALQNS